MHINTLQYIFGGVRILDSEISRRFQKLGECPRLDLGFPALSGWCVFYFLFEYVLYWAVRLYLYVAECPWLYMYILVTNACTRVVHFLYIYHACDVTYYCLIICVWLTLTLLQVPYPVSGLCSGSGFSTRPRVLSASRLFHFTVV